MNLPISPNHSNESTLSKSSFKFMYVIGKGGFGKVWKIEYKKTKETYALKEMSKLKVLDKKSLQEGESIHNNQINQAQDTFNKKYEEVNVQNNNLIKENAILTRKIEDYENNRNSLISDIDRKLKDALDQEKKLRNQYDNIKREKEGKIEQLKYQIENEKKKNKVKLEELENKLEEYEGKQNNINTNYIKEKAVNEKKN